MVGVGALASGLPMVGACGSVCWRRCGFRGVAVFHVGALLLPVIGTYVALTTTRVSRLRVLLFDACLAPGLPCWPTQLEGWWTYEFCYGSSVIQRHIPRDGEEESAYTLGLAQPPSRGGRGSSGSAAGGGGGGAGAAAARARSGSAGGGLGGSSTSHGGGGGDDGASAGQGSGGSAEGTPAPGMLGACPCVTSSFGGAVLLGLCRAGGGVRTLPPWRPPRPAQEDAVACGAVSVAWSPLPLFTAACSDSFRSSPLLFPCSFFAPPQVPPPPPARRRPPPTCRCIPTARRAT